MRHFLAPALLCAATAAHAQLPSFNAECPTGIQVHADQGGPVYIDGAPADLKRYSSRAFDATEGGITISIALLDDGTTSVAYTAPGGANGICELVVYHGVAEDACPVDVTEADRANYPACN